MIRLELQRHQREMDAWRRLCEILTSAHDAAISAAAEIEEIAPLVLPPEPAARPQVFLLIEPPADMSALPPAARQAILGAALNLGGGKGRAASTASAVDAAYQAAAEICCACVVGSAKVDADGKETIEHFQVRPVQVRAPGVMPLAAIELADRVAVQGAVQAHLATFRDLL